MAQDYIQLHPNDRQLLEKIWRKSITASKPIRRRYPPRYAVRRHGSRRRKDLLTVAVEALFDGLVWLLSQLILLILSILEWLFRLLAGLLLKLLSFIFRRPKPSVKAASVSK